MIRGRPLASSFLRRGEWDNCRKAFFPCQVSKKIQPFSHVPEESDAYSKFVESLDRFAVSVCGCETPTNRVELKKSLWFTTRNLELSPFLRGDLSTKNFLKTIALMECPVSAENWSKETKKKKKVCEASPKKIVASSKRLRKYFGICEGQVCYGCSKRSQCKRFLKPAKGEADCGDVIRALMGISNVGLQKIRSSTALSLVKGTIEPVVSKTSMVLPTKTQLEAATEVVRKLNGYLTKPETSQLLPVIIPASKFSPNEILDVLKGKAKAKRFKENQRYEENVLGMPRWMRETMKPNLNAGSKMSETQRKLLENAANRESTSRNTQNLKAEIEESSKALWIPELEDDEEEFKGASSEFFTEGKGKAGDPVYTSGSSVCVAKKSKETPQASTWRVTALLKASSQSPLQSEGVSSRISASFKGKDDANNQMQRFEYFSPSLSAVGASEEKRNSFASQRITGSSSLKVSIGKLATEISNQTVCVASPYASDSHEDKGFKDEAVSPLSKYEEGRGKTGIAAVSQYVSKAPPSPAAHTSLRFSPIPSGGYYVLAPDTHTQLSSSRAPVLTARLSAALEAGRLPPLEEADTTKSSYLQRLPSSSLVSKVYEHLADLKSSPHTLMESLKFDVAAVRKSQKSSKSTHGALQKLKVDEISSDGDTASLFLDAVNAQYTIENQTNISLETISNTSGHRLMDKDVFSNRAAARSDKKHNLKFFSRSKDVKENSYKGRSGIMKDFLVAHQGVNAEALDEQEDANFLRWKASQS